MYFIFYLDDLEIEEPQGFADIVLNMKRDDNWHGIFFEASTSDLSFYGAAATYLKNKKRAEGLKSDVTFKALQACGIYDEPEVILEGKLDFGKYSETRGSTCLVKIPVEQIGCLMTLRNRYDQKVDLDAVTTFNKLSALQQYDKLNFEMELPAKELLVSSEGNVYATGDIVEFDQSGTIVVNYSIRPTFGDTKYEVIKTSQLQTPAVNYTFGQQEGDVVSPILLYEDNPDCFSGTFNVELRMKGYIDISDIAFGSEIEVLQAVFIKTQGSYWVGSPTILAQQVIVQDEVVGSIPERFFFDLSYSDPTMVLAEGDNIYMILTGLHSAALALHPKVNCVFEQDTYVNIFAVKSCPSTNSNVYAINETLSRITEAITDNCLKVKSDYYGRTDSQPYTSAEDGCGSLRVVTSGLKIRNADNAALFASLKDMFDGLRGIDNIGIGIENNPFIPNYNWLRIESVDYFYQNVEILALPFVPEAEVSIQEQLHYSLIKSGYQKWEVEQINGLDEPNSNREYRTGLSSVNNTIDITSKLVAGSYPIEVTRQQSFAETGAADTTYDNETFIICVERQAYNFIVEQGNVDNAANVFSPETLYNWRIRPFSNLMRWFKSIANSYPNINDTANKLYFSSGTGNFLAEGELSGAYATCKLENGVKAENRDLGKLDFADTTEATPLWKPEYAELKYPLSVADYRTLKANPYGYISFQDGTGGWEKGYIQNLRYRLNKGEAVFTLKMRYD